MAQRIRDGVSRLFRLALRRPSHAAADMDAELRFHLESRIEHLVARGMARDAARAEALQRLAIDFKQARARLHQSAERRERTMQLREWVTDLAVDLRYAARGLSHRLGFTVMSIATLAIGIGATTAIFSAVNTMILRPLPFAEPDRLMKISLHAPRRGGGPGGRETSDMVWSYPKFLVFRDAQREYENLSLYSRGMYTVTGGDAERISGESVGARYLPTLGVRLARGRSFSDDEDAHAGSRRVAIIGDALWQRRFNADPDVVGKTMQIDRQTFDIVGVAPAGFRGLTGQAEVFIPFTAFASAEELAEPYSHTHQLVGRLKPNVTPEQAAQAAVLHGARVHQAYPMGGGFKGEQAWSARAISLDATRVSPVIKRSLFILLGAVGFVLLIACANLANLLLGRAATRRREIAVRLAIGAGRGRLVRLLLAESFLLAVLGGTTSLAVAWWGTRVLSGVNPTQTLNVQRIGGLGAVEFSSIHLDLSAFLFALVVTLVVAVLFGLAPAIQATSPALTDALKGGSVTRGVRGLRGLSSRRLLVVFEMALALVLLAGSGLMIRSLAKLMDVNAGFDARNLLTLRLNIPPGGLARDSLPEFYGQLLGRLRALPGVSEAALGDCAPLSGGCNVTAIERFDQPRAPGTPMMQVGVHWTTPGWFSVLRVPLVRGRRFEHSDGLTAPKVVLISELAASRYFPNEDPLGKRVGVGQGGFHVGATIVGIVGDVRYGRIDSLPGPDVYISYSQSPRSGMMVYLRTSGDPAALMGSVRSTIREIAPESPLYDIQTMSSRVASATAQTRFSAVLLALFAAVALALAVIGIYGVMSFAVTQRSREIGIRMALGADGGRVLGLVLREGVTLALIGGAMGLAGAFALTRILRGLLFGVTPSDPATFAGIVLVLGAAAVLASWLPARRAARVDPTVSLRSE